MVSVLLIGFSLVAATVAIHAFGLAGLVRFLMRERRIRKEGRSLPWLYIRLAWMIILLHGIEISLWAVAYWLSGSLADLNSAFYFSGTTYTTIGYGDFVLLPPWRMLAPLEGMTGILMCSLSGAFFFAVVTRTMAPAVEKG